MKTFPFQTIQAYHEYRINRKEDILVAAPIVSVFALAVVVLAINVVAHSVGGRVSPRWSSVRRCS